MDCPIISKSQFESAIQHIYNQRNDVCNILSDCEEVIAEVSIVGDKYVFTLCSECPEIDGYEIHISLKTNFAEVFTIFKVQLEYKYASHTWENL